MAVSQPSVATMFLLAFTAPYCAIAGGGGGPNPLTFEYYMLDNWQFWLVFFLMLFYGLVIDRLQFLVASSVEGDRLSKKIYERSITEFMIFGIVAITLFLVPVFADLPTKLNDKLTYCDLLVSFSACFLILLGFVYNSMRKWVKRHLETHDDLKDDVLQGVPLCVWTPMGPAMQQHFMTLHGLHKNRFSWNLYFQEALTSSICDLIDINWITWVIACIMVAPMVLIKHEFPVDKASGWVCSETTVPFNASNSSSNQAIGSRRLGASENGAYDYLKGCHFDYNSEYAKHYQMMWLTFTFTSVIVTLMTYLFTRHLRHDLYSVLSDLLEEEVLETKDGSDTSLKSERDRMAWWCPIMKQMVQVEALVMSFFLGMYVLHLRGLLLLNMVAFLVGLLIIQPLAILELSSVQAFVVTDHELLDSISQQVIQVLLDLKLVRHQLEAHPDAIQAFIKANGGERITKRSLQADLAAINVYISASRAEAIFNYLDTELDGDDQMIHEDESLEALDVESSDDASGHWLNEKGVILYDTLVEHTISVNTLMGAVFERTAT